MGQRIGKYEVKEEVGRGGFGRVLRAYDPHMKADVAIKILASDDGPEALERFRDEAGFMRKLEHKNIVTVYDFGEEGRSPYIVMELLEGKTLETVLKEQQALTLLQKMQIMTQIAEGLLYAHKKEVIHRDVKPGNVMLLPDGRIKLMDFGIARLLGASSHQRTRNGQVVGTTFYMAPELFRGSTADAQSDVFAYGVLCYQLISGKHPFEAEDFKGASFRILSTDPEPLGQVTGDCPEALESLVHRALAKDQMWRYPGFEELLLDAEPIVLELKREQAVRLTRLAAAAFADGDITTAEQRVKEALWIDSGNREAQDLRRRIRDDERRKKIHAHVIFLEQQAADLVAKRQFVDGCQKLEEALKLDPNSTRLSGLLETAQLKRKSSQEAGQKVIESKRREQLGHFGEARALVVEALEVDPGHPDAKLQLKRLDDRARERSRDTRLEKSLVSVSELRTLGKYSEALAALDSLSKEFPRIRAIQNMRALLCEELAVSTRANERAVLLSQAQNCLLAKNAAEAISLLEDGRKRYESDSVMEGWLVVARAVADVNSRERRLVEVLDQARALRDNGQLEQALEVLRTSQSVDGMNVQTTDLLGVFEIEANQIRPVPESPGPPEETQELPSEPKIPSVTFPLPARTCGACGTRLPFNARFCDGCGKSVVSRLV